MLPLYLEEVESMNPETATQEAIDNWNCLKYLQFYEGFHLAVDSLKTRGLHLQLYVYDVGKDSSQTVELLKKPEIKSADLIIGLIFHKNFRIVAGFARENNIPIVNPVSDRTEILRDNEMVFKVSPSRSFRRWIAWPDICRKACTVPRSSLSGTGSIRIRTWPIS